MGSTKYIHDVMDDPVLLSGTLNVLQAPTIHINDPHLCRNVQQVGLQPKINFVNLTEWKSYIFILSDWQNYFQFDKIILNLPTRQNENLNFHFVRLTKLFSVWQKKIQFANQTK